MVLFFTSPIGLGHATRDIAIAQQLRPMMATTSGTADPIHFISGGNASWMIQKNGFPALDLYRPERFSVESGKLQNSFRWLIGYLSYYRKCKAIAKNIMDRNEQSQLIVSDEDFASIAIGEEKKRKSILITDITETHLTSGPASIVEKMMNKTMRKMMERCDYVVIPDYGDDMENIRYVGPVVRQASADRNTLRKRFGFEKNIILVCIGGTDAGRYLIKRSIDAHRKIGNKLDSRLVVVSGPSIQLEDSADFQNLGAVENLHELVYASDLVISLAGRSTMDESIAYGTPGIFIPIKNHFEQEAGASRLGYRYEDIDRLGPLIEEKIGTRNNNNGNTTGARGAEKAAKIIYSLL